MPTVMYHGIHFAYSQVQESVEEVENSGFLATSSTLDVKLMANNKILQVWCEITTLSNPGCRMLYLQPCPLP